MTHKIIKLLEENVDCSLTVNKVFFKSQKAPNDKMKQILFTRKDPVRKASRQATAGRRMCRSPQGWSLECRGWQ